MELFTIQETAHMLKLTPATIRRYIAHGKLAAVKVERAVRVPKEAVEAFVTPKTPVVSLVTEEKPKAAKRERIPRGRPMTADDPLSKLMGSARSDGPTDVSVNKHHYIAAAYMPKRLPEE